MAGIKDREWETENGAKFLNALRSDIVNEAKLSGSGSRRLVVKITATLVTDLLMI